MYVHHPVVRLFDSSPSLPRSTKVTFITRPSSKSLLQCISSDDRHRDPNEQPTAAAGIGFCIVWGYFCEQGASKLHLVNQQHVSCHPTKAKHYNNILASLTEDCSTLHCIVYRSLSLNGTKTIMADTIYRCAVVCQPQLRNRFEEGSLLLFLTSLPLPDNRHFCLRVARHKSAFIRTLLSNIYRKMVLLYSRWTTAGWSLYLYCLGVEQRQIGCKKR